MILLGKSKSRTLQEGKGKRSNLHISTTENSQLYRDVVRSNQTSKIELFAKIVNGLKLYLRRLIGYNYASDVDIKLVILVILFLNRFYTYTWICFVKSTKNKTIICTKT